MQEVHIGLQVLSLRSLVVIAATMAVFAVDLGPSAAQGASGSKPVRLAVALDVPNDLTPEVVCVATPIPCKDAGCPKPQLELGTLVSQHVLVGGDTAGRNSYRFDRDTIKADRMADKHGQKLDSAFYALERPLTSKCAEAHQMCLPELKIPYEPAYPAQEQYLTCSKTDPPGKTSPPDNKRVVFLHVAFESEGTGAGVLSVALIGRVATITFNSKPPSSRVVVSVIGGDYAESQAIGTVERIDLKLHPRCQSYSVLLPPRAPSVGLKQDGKDAVEIEIGDGTRQVCDAEAHSGNAFTAMLPYRDDGKTKRIRVFAKTALSGDTTEFEASWSTPAPPRPVQLAYREIAITWRAHCLMAELSGDAIALDAAMFADGSTLVATASCPRITLVGAGADCTLSDDRFRDEQICRYRCRAPSTMPAFQLPSPARLARFLGNPGKDPHLVSEWNDTVEYAGQQLSSYEPPANRSLVVSLKDRPSWGGRRGDRIYAIEVEVSGKVQRIVLSGKTEAEQDSEPWFRVAAPGLSCADPVRMHVDGTREYWLRTVPTRSGVLVLDKPRTYRDELRPGSAFGVAFGPWSLTPWLSGQLAGEKYLDWLTPGAGELGLDYHVGRLDYLGVTPPALDSAVSSSVWYHRLAAKAKYTWWRWADVHIGIGIGGGFGIPVLHRDRQVVGGLDWSFAVEPFVRFRSLLRNNSWVEVGIDIRMGEDRWDFTTDFHGQPSRSPSRSIDGSLELRIRFGNG